IHKINLGSIESIEDRELILKSIQKWAPGVSRSAELIQALEPPPNHSYTELWLQALSAAPKRERLKPLSSGTYLKKDSYMVIEQLGSGGQGMAYLANDAYGSTVVLKEFIMPVFVDVNVRRSALEQFENEAKLLRQLNHPQIVKLIDFFVEDHRSYLVLEHINGMSLQDLVKKRGALPEKDVISLIQQMSSILSYLHNLNPPVVHRDFTPDNLILNKDGTLKLIDFNVARQVIESTTSGTVVGKHAYLPPEQFRGMPERASDIYSMGATIHFLLTACEPEPISSSHPQKLRPELSPILSKMVEKATALDLKKRFRTIEELDNFMKDENPKDLV
ncbi:MAG: serine/threonine protein kinase, partial [Candidatus Obscuribacterales bacterium]|nr:serine/threonine protein kinase [Candidatus Obscuribacterales bacterium]